MNFNKIQPLGSVIQGSLSGGLEVRLHPDISVEDMRVGKFLVVEGTQYQVFLSFNRCLFRYFEPSDFYSSS